MYECVRYSRKINAGQKVSHGLQKVSSNEKPEYAISGKWQIEWSCGCSLCWRNARFGIPKWRQGEHQKYSCLRIKMSNYSIDVLNGSTNHDKECILLTKLAKKLLSHERNHNSSQSGSREQDAISLRYGRQAFQVTDIIQLTSPRFSENHSISHVRTGK